MRRRRLRPTSGLVRGALFSMLGPDGARGRRVLDLYAGTGALGLEALRRGGAFAEFVERDDRLCRAIKAEATRDGVAMKCQVHRGRVERVVDRLQGQYDIVFIDPPYAENPFQHVLEVLGGPGKLASDAIVFAEHDRRLDLEPRYGGLLLEEVRHYGDTAVSIFRPEMRREEQEAILDRAEDSEHSEEKASDL